MAKESHKTPPAPPTAAAPEFSGDDAIFLVWTLGFTAGANLERDGERGERIFARCRQLHEKIAPIAVRPRAGGDVAGGRGGCGDAIARRTEPVMISLFSEGGGVKRPSCTNHSAELQAYAQLPMVAAAPKLDTSNIFGVVRTADGAVVVMNALGGALTAAEALNLAAWLVLMAQPGEKEFQRLLQQIQST